MIQTRLFDFNLANNIQIYNYLCIREEENDTLILKTSLEKHVFQIFPPLGHSVILTQLNLKDKAMRNTINDLRFK